MATGVGWVLILTSSSEEDDLQRKTRALSSWGLGEIDRVKDLFLKLYSRFAASRHTPTHVCKWG